MSSPEPFSQDTVSGTIYSALRVKAEDFTSAATRSIKKHRVVSPRRGFYLILRPEDRVAGAPEPARRIDPLMKYLKLDYRVSLLRAAAFHGSSHQAAMVFQVVVPKQLRNFDLVQIQAEPISETLDAMSEVLAWLVKFSYSQANQSTHLLFKFEPESAVLTNT